MSIVPSRSHSYGEDATRIEIAQGHTPGGRSTKAMYAGKEIRERQRIRTCRIRGFCLHFGKASQSSSDRFDPKFVAIAIPSSIS